MNTTQDHIPADIMAAMQEAANNAAKAVRDPERVKRSRQSMDRIREEIQRQHGILDIGVHAIRELRDQ